MSSTAQGWWAQGGPKAGNHRARTSDEDHVPLLRRPCLPQATPHRCRLPPPASDAPQRQPVPAAAAAGPRPSGAPPPAGPHTGRSGRHGRGASPARPRQRQSGTSCSWATESTGRRKQYQKNKAGAASRRENRPELEVCRRGREACDGHAGREPNRNCVEGVGCAVFTQHHSIYLMSILVLFLVNSGVFHRDVYCTMVNGSTSTL